MKSLQQFKSKNTDVADKSYLKDLGKKPTIKSDLKNLKNFLTGKKETMESVTEAHKVGDSVTVNSKFFGKQKGKVTKVDGQSIHVQRSGKQTSEKYPHDAVVKEEIDKSILDEMDTYPHPDSKEGKALMKSFKSSAKKDPTDLNAPGKSPTVKQTTSALLPMLNKSFKKSMKKEEVELTEVSKSEVDSHFHSWTNSEHAPYNSDAGDDKKVHQSAMSYLRSTNVPKEKHEKLAMHIADKFHGSGIDEEAERINELSKSTLGSYVKKAAADSTITRKIATDFEHRAKRAKKQDMKDANASISNDFKEKSFKRKANIDKAVNRLTNEEKDPREYDFEGDMAKSQLRSIIANSQTIHDMLEDNTNMAEWVQSKITLASDYITTVKDYITSETNEEIKMQPIHPSALHVKPVKTATGTKYKVHAVGKKFASGVKVGEHLSDTELDDFSEMGGKIKHMKESTLSDILEMARGRPRKNPLPVKAKSNDDEEHDDEVDTGPEADQNIHMQLKRAHDARDLKGGADVKFENGKKHFIKSEHAHKVVTALEKLKPADRSTAASHIYKSHDNFQAVHSMLK